MSLHEIVHQSDYPLTFSKFTSLYRLQPLFEDTRSKNKKLFIQKYRYTFKEDEHK